MTFAEAKEQVAKRHGYTSWEALVEIPLGIYSLLEEAATLWQTESCKETWVSVNDKLPENTDDVLCLMGKSRFVGKYTKGHELEYADDDYQGEYDEYEERNGTLYLKPGWYEFEEQVGGEYDEYWIKREVTHWQPLPPTL